jgi:hypothetical protein
MYNRQNTNLLDEEITFKYSRALFLIRTLIKTKLESLMKGGVWLFMARTGSGATK